MYKKTFLKRFVIYPVFIGFFVIKMLEVMSGFEIGALFTDLGPISFLKNELYFLSIPYSYLEVIYAYSVGYAYGTISVFFSVRKMGIGLVSFVFFYIKMALCMFVFSSISMLLIPLELAAMFIFAGLRNINKGMKKRESNRLEYLNRSSVAG